MSKDVVGVGILGAGMMGHRFASACQQLQSHCRLIAVADIMADRAQRLAEQYEVPGAYQDYEKLLLRRDIDLVVVATPPFEHCRQVLDALAAGKHVLCEKPMAASPGDCDRMIEAARQNGLVLAGATQHRFDPAVRQARALIASGELGRPLLASFRGLWWRAKEYYNVWWRGTWERECGGTLLNHHSHFLDLLLHLLGDVAWVDCEMDTLANDIEVEDSAVLQMRFRNGTLASVLASSAAHHGDLTCLELAFEHAGLTLNIGQPLRISCSRPRNGGFAEPDPDAARRLEELAERLAPEPPFKSHVAVLQDCLEAVMGAHPPFISGLELRRSVELAVAAYKSASRSVRVELPLAPSDPFYTTEGILSEVKRSPRGAARRKVEPVV